MRKCQSKFKLSDGSITYDKSVVSEKFIEFFTGIGPSLAKKIPKQTLSPLVVVVVVVFYWLIFKRGETRVNI